MDTFNGSRLNMLRVNIEKGINHFLIVPDACLHKAVVRDGYVFYERPTYKQRNQNYFMKQYVYDWLFATNTYPKLMLSAHHYIEGKKLINSVKLSCHDMDSRCLHTYIWWEKGYPIISILNKPTTDVGFLVFEHFANFECNLPYAFHNLTYV